MYSVYEIDNIQVKNIMSIQENFLNDIKAKEIKPAKLSETVSAFANAAGGDLYIGIAENSTTEMRTWAGFNDPEDANDFAHTLFQAHPFGNHIKLEFLTANGMNGLVLTAVPDN